MDPEPTLATDETARSNPNMPALPRYFGLRPPQLALVGLVTAIVVVLAAAVMWPERVYYPFVWRYIWGPTVTDDAGGPITLHGVTAYSGYNLVDTTTYASILGVGLWNLIDYLRLKRVTLTRTLTYSLVPMIIAGGTMRGLVQIHWLSAPWSYAFITPYIYFVFFFYTLAALILGIIVDERTGGRVKHWHFTLAAGALAMLGTWTAWASYVLHPPTGTLHWEVLPKIFGYSAILTLAIVAILWIPQIKFVRDPLYVLVLYGQIVDGMQNYIGVTQGYTSKLMGPNFLAGFFGDAGLLVGKVALMVPLLAYLRAKVEPVDNPNTTQLLLLAILALGLAMGFHGGVPMLLGL